MPIGALNKLPFSPADVYSQATRPATATTAAARLPTACWAPGAAAPVELALALPVAVADTVAVACIPDGTAALVADVTMVLVQEQAES
jgi:hypothetical protein